MKIRTREIAKAGIFGSKENPEIVTEKDLQEIAETFAEIKTAPVKLGGHWTENRPRLGNVVSVEYDKKAKRLFATIEENDVLAKAVDEEGFYPDVSIGAKARASDGKMYLHHLAYLGDEPPAIKDLEQSIATEIQNGEADATQIAAADDDKTTLKTYPSSNATQLFLSDTDPNQSTKVEDKEKSQTEETMTATEDEFKAMQEENAKLKAELEAKEKMLSDSKAAQHAADKDALKKACEGKVTETELEQILALSDSFAEGRTITLSDGDKKTEERPTQILARIFQNVPKKVEPGILNLSDSSPKTEKVESLSKKMIANV